MQTVLFVFDRKIYIVNPGFRDSDALSPASPTRFASFPKVMLLFPVQSLVRGTKADIFAWIRGVINIIKNGICRQAVGKIDLADFSFFSLRPLSKYAPL